MIFVDWSINVDSVVYSVVVNNVVTKTVDGDVELSMDSTSTHFQLSESDTHQALVKECLVSGSAYQLTFRITSDDSCTPGILTIITESATPVYNKTSTDIFTTIDTDIVESFSDAFIIEIPNDQIYGGCGSFACNTLHLNRGTVQLLYNTVNGVFEARRSEIVFGFTYNVEVKCLDKSDLGFVTGDHTIVVNLTFWELTTTSTSTTMFTLPTSTTVSLPSLTQTKTTVSATSTVASGLTSFTTSMTTPTTITTPTAKSTVTPTKTTTTLKQTSQTRKDRFAASTISGSPIQKRSTTSQPTAYASSNGLPSPQAESTPTGTADSVWQESTHTSSATQTAVSDTPSTFVPDRANTPCPTLTPVKGSNTGYYGAFATKFDGCE